MSHQQSNTTPDLAIVIPAYKIDYLDKTLLSIARQTCKEFTVYIGDDASPYPLKYIIDKYRDKIRINYKYFDDNLGKNDLVAHWERCIDLIGDENWIWLFSDDDLMEQTCVEEFYNTVQKYSDFDLFHFNVRQIDENDKVTGHLSAYPEILSVEEFLIKRLKGGFRSYVVEYIFRKSIFYEKGRFENFDLAWCSDDATWIKLGHGKGIRTIEKSKIFWRRSSLNITSDVNQDILERKFNAEISFADWVIKQTQENKVGTDFSKINELLKRWFLSSIKSKINLLSFQQVRSYISRYYLINNFKNCSDQMLFLFYFKNRIYAYLKGMLKRLLHLNYIRSKLRVRATIYSE